MKSNLQDIVLVISTYRRPLALRSALEAISRQKGVAPNRISTVVLDNDPAESARPVVDALSAGFPFPVEYIVVHDAGLSNVRNTALAVAHARASLLAMMDDDEMPEPHWLSELLRIQLLTGADAVIGPVPRVVPPTAPAWIRRGTFYEVPRFADGELVNDGYTGNCLLHVGSKRFCDLRFDDAFNTAGGEDQFFFRQLLASGGRIAYAANAIAAELVVANRLCMTYILRRAFRRGNTLWYCDARIHGTAHMTAIRICKALARVTLGAVTILPRSVVRGKTGLVEALVDIVRGAGTLAGMCGVVFLEYDRATVARYGTEAQTG